MAKINTAILAVMKDIATTGIAKTENHAQGWSFRGIEAAMNSLSPLMVAHGITVTPQYSELTLTVGATSTGKAIRYCTLKGSFKFEAEDGSSVVSECYGESMDSGDKSVVKAQSIAFRTALFQQFIVPTMAIDPEIDNHESIIDGWVGYASTNKQDPIAFERACKEGRKALSEARDVEGLKQFNAAVAKL